MRVSKSDFAAIRALSAKRAAKRAVRVGENRIIAAIVNPEAGVIYGSSESTANAPPRLWGRRDVTFPINQPKRLKSKPRRPRRLKAAVKRGTLKTAIIRLLGLLDRQISGPLCRLGVDCPDFPKIGEHLGTLAYHLVPAQRGDATRFIPENVVWSCRAANYGEVMNRSLYREKHIAVFGRERIERLELLARSFRQYSKAELLELRDSLRTKLER